MSKRKVHVAEDLLLNKVVLRPQREHARFPEVLGRPFESFTTYSTANNQFIGGWYFPGDKPASPLALLNASNRGTKADALDHAALLLKCGCGVLLYDYQGYGDSGGLADVRTLVGDAEGVLNWASERGISEMRQSLVLAGLSLGSLVATHLAATYPQAVRALILDGAIEPYRVLRRSFGPLGAAMAEVACLQVPDELNSQKQIESVRCPVLFVHGRKDTISTPGDVEHLAGRVLRASIWTLDDCDHLDIIVKHRHDYQDRLCLFLDDCAVR